MVNMGFQGHNLPLKEDTAVNPESHSVDDQLADASFSVKREQVVILKHLQDLFQKSKQLLQKLSRINPLAVEFTEKALLSIDQSIQFADSGNMKGATVSLQLSYNELIYARKYSSPSSDLGNVLNSLEEAWDNILLFVNKPESRYIEAARKHLQKGQTSLNEKKQRLKNLTTRKKKNQKTHG